MKIKSFERGRTIFGQVIYRKDPDISDLHTVKAKTDCKEFYFMFKNASYTISLDDIIDEVKQHHAKLKKSTKTK